MSLGFRHWAYSMNQSCAPFFPPLTPTPHHRHSSAPSGWDLCLRNSSPGLSISAGLLSAGSWPRMAWSGRHPSPGHLGQEAGRSQARHSNWDKWFYQEEVDSSTSNTSDAGPTLPAPRFHPCLSLPAPPPPHPPPPRERETQGQTASPTGAELAEAETGGGRAHGVSATTAGCPVPAGGAG